MTKVINNNQLFQIAEYNLFDDEIEVFTEKNGEEKHFMISRREFEDWLSVTDRLDWVRDEIVNGEYEQTSGTISANQFWEQKQGYINECLYEFILVRKMNNEKVFTSIFDELNSICRNFNPKIKISDNCNPVLRDVLKQTFPHAQYSKL